MTWERGDGTPQTVPVTPYNSQVIDPVPTGSNLLNTCAVAVDDQNRPHITHYYNDADGIPQYRHLWQSEGVWKSSIVSRRTVAFSVSGAGSLDLPISRPEIAIDRHGIVWIITRDRETGGGVRVFHAAEPFTKWDHTDLTTDDLGNCEPVYDLVRWRAENMLSLFVLPVRQGNGETVTDFPPQPAAVLDWFPSRP